MAQKYDIYHESGWDEKNQAPVYEKLTTVKNEQSAFDYVNDIENLGKYGNMIIRMRAKGNVLTYNENNGKWESEDDV